MLNMIINIIINLILVTPFICLIACAVRESKICVKYNDMGLTRCRVCGALTVLGAFGIYLFLVLVIEFLIRSDKAAYFANLEHPKILAAFCIAGIPLAIIPYKIALKRCPQELRKGFLFDLVSIGMGVLLKLEWALALLLLYLFFKLLGIVTDLGETKKLEFESLPDGVTPEFVTADTDYITVDEKGNVRGLKVGDAVVRARVGKGTWTWAYVDILPTSSEKEAARQKFAEDVLYYVNIERAKEGLAPLQLMDELSYLAQIRTDEQAAVRTISHTRPDGTKWSTVFNEARSPMPKKASAENLIQSAGYDAETCVARWMASPGHRANILRPNMTHMGVGVEFTNSNFKGAYIATQLFIQYNG